LFQCFFLLRYGIDAAMQYCANNVDWKSDINLSIYAKDDQTQPSKATKHHPAPAPTSSGKVAKTTPKAPTKPTTNSTAIYNPTP
jgi:hypothetical protein